MTLNETNIQILEELKKLNEQKASKKKFNIPFGKRVNQAKAKKNYVTLIKVNENLNLDFKVVQINDQTILEDKVPRLALSKYIMYYKKNPIIILPSWSVEPFDPRKHLEDSLANGSNKAGYAILMEKMEKEKLGGKKEISGMIKWIFGLGILALIGYAFISGGV